MKFGRLEFVGKQIVFDTRKECFISQMVAEHVKDPTTFIIGVPIEHLLLVVIIKPDQVMVTRHL